MRETNNETPPSSINGDDEINPFENEEEMIYIGDADDILDLEDGESIEGEDSDGSDDEPPPDMASLVFLEHSKSVFCCHLHPNKKLAVTGGEDDKAYVWNIENAEVVNECSGHKDSVIFAGFSFDGNYLATADMAGYIQIWKCVDGPDPWPRVWDYEAGELTWGLWHPGTRVLIFGGQDGEMYVFKVPSGETKVLQGNHVKVECAKLFPDGRKLAAGYDDGSIKIWDLKSEQVTYHIQQTGHSSGITSIDVHPDNNLIITVSSDGKAVLSAAATGKVKSQIDTDEELETVAFSKDADLGFFALGTLEGNISVWDVSKQILRYYCMKKDENDSSGVTKLFWEKNYLIAACLDGSIRIYDGRSGERLTVLTGHRFEVLDVSYLPKENLLLTSSQDTTARLFKFEPVTEA